MLDGVHPNQPFVLLEDSRGGTSYLFTDMASAITATDALGVASAFESLRSGVAGGAFAAGWLGFEAGYALEPRQHVHLTAGDELLWFGLFRQRRSLTPLEDELLWRSATATPQPAHVTAVVPRWSAETYAAHMMKVHDYILAGDIYQANLTFAADVAFEGTALALYRQLRNAQRVPYAALIFTGNRWILSFSPEKFFDLRGDQLTAQPMKGTAARTCLPELDALAASSLQQDAKNRAENLMIVDLLRNDLSRVAVPGSVQVPSLYEIVSYPTVHQMVSTITATLAPDRDALDVLQALFPCGSITGAPKLRAMDIICEQESDRRGIYCGAIGEIAPDGKASFNVAIRTLDIKAPGRAVIGLGSGVVADSVANEEYREGLLKAKFLTQQVPPFDLIETLLWQPDGGWSDWSAHMARLQYSADYWHFMLQHERIADEAAHLAHGFDGVMRVRLLVSRFGETCWQWQPLRPAPPQAYVVLSPQAIYSDMPFLFHKTSHRSYYDDERQQLQAKTGCFECLFRNERDELTEGSFTNIFMRKGRHLLTPPLSCGLLPGVLRQKLVDSGEAREAILTLEDVRHADALLIGNSVRGLMEVELREF